MLLLAQPQSQKPALEQLLAVQMWAQVRLQKVQLQIKKEQELETINLCGAVQQKHPVNHCTNSNLLIHGPACSISLALMQLSFVQPSLLPCSMMRAPCSLTCWSSGPKSWRWRSPKAKSRGWSGRLSKCWCWCGSKKSSCNRKKEQELATNYKIQELAAHPSPQAKYFHTNLHLRAGAGAPKGAGAAGAAPNPKPGAGAFAGGCPNGAGAAGADPKSPPISNMKVSNH